MLDANGLGCPCCDEKTTRAEMEARHGNLVRFQNRVWEVARSGEISASEAEAACKRYRRQWEQAPQ